MGKVLITGCSSGIGRALAIELAGRGHHVVASARRVGDIEGVGSEQVELDATSDTSVTAAAQAVGPVDILVNNAGIGLWAPIEAVPVDQARALFEVNFFGALRTQRAFLPGMRARRSGQIIQVSSAVGRMTGPLIGHYAASKHALEAMSAALRIEVAPFGIKVAIIELGAIDSDFGSNRLAVTEVAGYAEVIAHFTRNLMAARSVPTTSADCARTIADVIDAGAPDLMVEGTADATSIVAGRRRKTDAEWEAGLLEGLTLSAAPQDRA